MSLGLGLDRLGLGFAGRGGGASIVSASTRSKLPVTTGTGGGNYGTTTVQYIYYRSIHRSNKSVKGVYGWFWNGAVDAAMGNAGWEHGPAAGQVKTVRAAILTGITSPLLADQTGAVVTPVTFSGIQTGAKRIKDLTYATRTFADFVTAGGAVSGDNKTVTIPSGWGIEHDNGPDVVARVAYAYQIEDGVPGASGGTPLQQCRVGITAPLAHIGDYSKNSATIVTTTAGKHLCEDPAWTSGNGVSGVSATSSNVGVYAPIIVLGTDAAGSKTVGVDGDSIFDEKQDTVRDGDGVAHGISRALNAAGYSFFKVAAFSSSMGNQKTFGGNAWRLGLLEYADAVVTNHGHNDMGALTTDAQVKTLLFWHGTALRGAMKASGKKRLVRATLTPTTVFATAQAGGSTTTVQLASSSSAVDGFYNGLQIAMTTGTAIGQWGTITGYVGATKVATVSPGNTWSIAAVGGNYVINMPVLDPATDPTFILVNPYLLRTGAYASVPFDTASGDPDAVFDNFTSMNCTAGHWEQVLDTFDGTHDSSLGSAKSQAYATPAMLQTLLGF